jgi:hypothetical protein
VPTAKIETLKKYRLPNATAANTRADTRPTINVSTTPIDMKPTWTSTTGSASATIARSSA